MQVAKQAGRKMLSLQSLGDYKQAINRAIEQFLDTMPTALGFAQEALSPHSIDALTKLREYTMRPGKRIRGGLAAAAYDDARGTVFGEAGIALGVAEELIQSYILISDDVTDRSTLRRGKPTVHQEFLAELDAYGDEHEANMLAEYVGLISEQLSYLALLQAPERPEHIVRSLYSLHRNLTMTGFGQVDDVNHKIGRAVSEDEIIRVYYFKTGFYTFVNPLQAGLELAGVTDTEALGKINDFGMAAGIAFQMHDDYLGVFGDTAETGKPSVDDLKEGKYTLLVQYAFTHASKSDLHELRDILGNDSIDASDVARAQKIFNNTGATLYMQSEARRYADIAKAQLDSITVLSNEFKQFLTDIIEYAITRKS